MHINTIVELDARAVRASVDLVNRADPADLSRPTPCADWTLHGLITHMTAQHYGFAAAAAGDARLDRWKPRRLGPDPAGDYRAAADTVLTAFSGATAPEFPLPEFPGSPSVPAQRAIGFHFLDYVVHSWDVARTVGADIPGLDDGLLAAALAIAEAVPGGEARTAAGAAFAPAVRAPGNDGQRPLDAIVALLGRDPDWAPRNAARNTR